MGDLKDNKPHTDRMSLLSAKVLFRIHKDLSEVNNKGANTPVLKWAEDLNKHSTREGVQGTSDRKKLIIYHQAKANENPRRRSWTHHTRKQTSHVDTHAAKNALSYCWGGDTGVRLCERARRDLSPLDSPEIVLKIFQQQLINPCWKLPFQLTSRQRPRAHPENEAPLSGGKGVCWQFSSCTRD